MELPQSCLSLQSPLISWCARCAPAVKVLPAEVQAHVLQQLADAGRHEAMAQLIVRLSRQDQQAATELVSAQLRTVDFEAGAVHCKKRKHEASSHQGEPVVKRSNAAAVAAAGSSAAAAATGTASTSGGVSSSAAAHAAW